MKSIFKISFILLIANLLSPITAFAEGDAASGEGLFKKKCKICHTNAKGDKAKIGPNLYGVYERKAGHFENYKYSKNMLEANLTWDEATLDAYLTKPKAIVPKGKMVFAGFKKEKDRQDIIAYLKSLHD